MQSATAILLNILLLALVIANSGAILTPCGLGLLFGCPADSDEPWSYRGRNGPRFWGETAEDCNGENQSPINIHTSEVVTDANLAKLEFNNYDIPVTTAEIENNGHTIQVTPGDGEARTISVDGTTYTLAQFHFHWGCFFFAGSEHTVDHRRYAMEMHLVHMSEDGRIAVVGVFFQEGSDSNEELQKLPLSEVTYKGSSTAVESSLNLNGLMPENRDSFYRYNGSLTTPGCAEGVTWSVLTDPIPVGRSQMAEFRKLYSSTEEDATLGCRLSGNYRPVQDLNGRTVFLAQ